MLLMGKSTISVAIFHSKMLVHQRVKYGAPFVPVYHPQYYGHGGPIFRFHVTDMTKNLWTTKENDGKSWQILRTPKKNGGKTTENAGTTHGTCWDQGKCWTIKENGRKTQGKC